VKLFLDENLSPQHAAELRTEGYDAVAVLEVGYRAEPTNKSSALLLRTAESSSRGQGRSSRLQAQETRESS
jgi:predicted nuclease of predicted toxin-antitoxin system